MNYYQVNFSLGLKARNFDADLLKNALLPFGFDSFVDKEEANAFEAYCPEKDFSSANIQKAIDNSYIENKSQIQYDIVFIKDENWNKLWEETSPSVQFGDFCHIRKQKQPYRKVKYDIIINPCQSFGTANHPTTALIIEFLSSLNMQGKNVMDMGCGTAVLGILCKKMGAGYVEAIDIDSWAFQNALDNAKSNNADITVKLGSSEAISKDINFDIFIANINLNILLDNMEAYAGKIKSNGLMVLSGFFPQDAEELNAKAATLNFAVYKQSVKDGWALSVLKKQ